MSKNEIINLIKNLNEEFDLVFRKSDSFELLSIKDIELNDSSKIVISLSE